MTNLLSIPDKICPVCSKAFNRRRMPSGRLQDAKLFEKQMYCSRTCGNTRDVLTKHGYSWRARKHLGKACEACGFTKKLQAHHIDQDKTNNTPENIQTLCKHCHDYWHTTEKRIGWVIAGRMPSVSGGKKSLQSVELPKESKIGHTVSKQSGTAKSRSKQPSHGDCSGVSE